MKRITLTTKSSSGYELLDSGREEKLERFGNVVLSRPDPQALWAKTAEGGSPGSEELREKWDKANGKYERTDKEGLPAGKAGKWTGKMPKEWPVEFGGLKFILKPTSFKHVGLFPEQLSNWEWVRARCKDSSQGRDERDPNSPAKNFTPSILNLFGYTGGATLAAAKAGAEVTHVDASKSAVAWARENASGSGLADKTIRWIVEDAVTFVERELKRGKRYDAIIMDPPAFGHGPKNELWKIEEDFLKLIELCQQLLSEKPLFFLINGYAAGYSPLAFAYNLEPTQKKFGGTIEYGDLTIEQKGSERALPCGIFARWRQE